MVLPPEATAEAYEIGEEAYVGPGTMINSEFLKIANGRASSSCFSDKNWKIFDEEHPCSQ